VNGNLECLIEKPAGPFRLGGKKGKNPVPNECEVRNSERGKDAVAIGTRGERANGRNF